MKAIIDTCIVVDALQKREPFFSDAKSIFLLCANLKFDGFLSTKTITDIDHLIHHQTHSNEETRKTLRTLCNLFHLLDTTSLDIQKAISSEVSDFEGAVRIKTAIRSKLDCIVTRNTSDYKKSVFPVYTPSEFIKLVKEESKSSSVD